MKKIIYVEINIHIVALYQYGKVKQSDRMKKFVKTIQRINIFVKEMKTKYFM